MRVKNKRNIIFAIIIVALLITGSLVLAISQRNNKANKNTPTQVKNTLGYISKTDKNSLMPEVKYHHWK